MYRTPIEPGTWEFTHFSTCVDTYALKDEVCRAPDQKHYQANHDAPIFEELLLEQAHKERNLAEYEGDLDVTESFVLELIEHAAVCRSAGA